MSGKKNDEGKARYDLISPSALDGMVEVLTFGAKKYGDYNWSKGIKYSRVFAALQRHLWAWWSGKDNDEETGLSHLDHASCCIHFLCHYIKGDYKDFDDRPSSKPDKPEPKLIIKHSCTNPDYSAKYGLCSVDLCPHYKPYESCKFGAEYDE